MDVSSDKGADLPPLLINPSAPLAPYQPGLAMCEPLEKPDTPTGDPPGSLIADAPAICKLSSQHVWSCLAGLCMLDSCLGQHL